MPFGPDEDEVAAALERASDLEAKIQDYPGKRTLISTDAGYRIEVQPPRDCVEAAPEGTDGLRLADETLLRLLPSGPDERPELVGEVLV